MAKKKKPVWVDEDAHGILKQYSKLVKSSMVDVASDMVLDKLGDLPADAGLETPESSEAKEESQAKPKAKQDQPSKKEKAADDEVIKTADAPPKVDEPEAGPPKQEKPSRDMPKEDDSDTRFLGGVWLI
jgi:hypothetical protein